MSPDDRNRVMAIVIQLCPQILVCGWWSLEEDVVWYAIWRDRHRERIVDEYINRATGSTPDRPRPSDPDRPEPPRYLIKPLYEGELFALEAEQTVRQVFPIFVQRFLSCFSTLGIRAQAQAESAEVEGVILFTCVRN
jgi:hypothetical protein